jgi:hypothetical protein
MIRRLLRVVGYAAVAVGVLLVVIFGVGVVLWKHYASPREIHKHVKQEIGRRVRGQTRIRWASLSPGLRLSLEGLSVRIPAEERPLIESEEIEVQFDRSGLLRGRVVPRKVVLTRPEVAFRRDPATGRWNVQNLLLPEPEGKRFVPPPGLLRDGLLVEDGAVALRSWRIFKDPDTHRVEGLNLRIVPGAQDASLWDVSGEITRGALSGMSMRGWLGKSGFRMDAEIDDMAVDGELLGWIPVGRPIEEIFHPRGRIRGSVTVGAEAGMDKPRYSARIELRRMRSRTKFYDATMTEVAGRVLIIGGRVLFRDVTGEILPQELGLEQSACHPVSVRIDGSYTMHPESVHMQLEATGFPVTERSIREIPKVGDKVWEALRPGGFGDLSLSVEDLPGKEIKPTFKAVVDLRDASLDARKLPFKLKKLVGRVEIDEERVKLRDMRGVIQQEGRTPQIAVRGVFDVKGDPLDVTVEVTNLYMNEKLVRAIPDMGDALWTMFHPTGVADGSFTIRHREGQKPKVSGSLQVYNGTVKSKFFPLPLRNVAASIRFDDEVIQIARLSGRIVLEGGQEEGVPPGRLLLTGEVSRDAKTGSLGVQVPSLRLTEPVVRALPELGQPLWARLQPEGLMSLSGRIDFDRDKEEPVSYLMAMDLKDGRATWEGFQATMSSLNGTVLLSESSVLIPHVSGNVAGGPFDASGFVNRSEDGTVRYNGTMEYRRVDVRRLIYELIEEETTVRGRLSGLVEVGGRTGEQGRIRGVGSAELTEGQVWKAPVFFGLVDVLHLSAPGEHGRFDRGEMRFSFDSEKMHLHSFRLGSPAAELTGQGTVGLEKRDLDLTIVAATLPQGGLPVIGQALRTVLRPVERQLIRVQVTGTIEDPKYSPQPLQKVTRPITSIFELLTSPFRGEKKKEEK